MERYKIEIKKSAYKEIRDLPQKDLQAILKSIGSLSQNPRPFGSKKLSQEEKYRIRAGNYRILYYIKDKILTIYVVKIAHRKDVYRKY